MGRPRQAPLEANYTDRDQDGLLDYWLQIRCDRKYKDVIYKRLTQAGIENFSAWARHVLLVEAQRLQKDPSARASSPRVGFGHQSGVGLRGRGKVG